MLELTSTNERMNIHDPYRPVKAELRNYVAASRLLILKHFLEKPLCARLRAEITAATVTQAKVFKRADSYFVTTDVGARKTMLKQVSDATKALVLQRLLAVKPVIEQHFGAELSGCEEPQFLWYGAGDFFRPHYDGIPEPSSVAEFAYLHARRVSVVLFLNDQSAEAGPDTYSGGTLRFYGPKAFGSLSSGEGKLRVSLRPAVTEELRGESGLLVAFRPNLLHEVEVVRGGGRHTIASWYF